MNPRTGDQVRCTGGHRREMVRAHPDLNGLDYLEVSPDGRRLTVYFLDRAPADLLPGNLRVVGGRRVPNVAVVGVDVCRSRDLDRDDCLTVDLDRAGDSTCYRLEVVEADEWGRPTDRPHPGFDPRYWWLGLDFTVDCPSDLDCAGEPAGCAPAEPADGRAPDISYLARDYQGLRTLLLDRMALTVPGWTERHAPDLQLALLEILAYVGDQLSYEQDAIGTEAYLRTARLRTSVRRHARLVDYRMHEGCTAWTWMVLTSDTDLLLGADIAFVTSLAATLGTRRTVVSRDDLARVPADRYRWFEPTLPGPVTVIAARSEIRFYTWSDTECCLPAGSTRATLLEPVEPVDADLPAGARSRPGDEGALRLCPGEVLVLEEVRSPATGLPEDADPAHRHAVRLTDVARGVDPLTGVSYVEVAWADADALPFDLCLSSVGRPPQCAPIDPVSVARGNAILVDQGRTVQDPLGEVPVVAVRPTSCDDDCPTPPGLLAGAFRPALPRGPLTWRTPHPPDAPASAPFATDPRVAVPALELHDGTRSWTAVPDLLASDPDDPHLVVEVDDEQLAHLRFGDDVLGRAPAAGATFTGHYRIGNGTAGNVGAGSLVHLVVPGRLEGAGLAVCNPLPARGGIDPELVADVRRLAPGAFRRDRQRAVTATDYAELAARDVPGVQGGQAELRWNGSWYEARVAVDARGTAEPSEMLLAEVADRLARYRRIGHDLRVVPALDVGVDIVLQVCIGADHRRDDVARALRARLGNRRLPGGRLGMFHPDALTFGSRVAASAIVAAAAAVPGVEAVTVTRLQRHDGRDPDALAAGALELAPGEVPRLDDASDAPEHGTLTLDLVGGR